MTAFSLTAAERVRIERIDQLVVLGAAGVADLVEVMSDPSWTVRRAAVAALAAAGDEAAPALCRWLSGRRTSEHAIAAAVDALAASIGGATTNAAVGALLDHANPAVVADGAQILGRRRATELVAALERLLDHADDNVVLAAIDALGLIGAASSIEPLIAVLAKQSFFRTFAALQMLPKTGDPRVVAPLAALIGSDTYRIEAIHALGRTGSALAIGPLAGVLAHGDALIRPIARAFAELLARAEWSGATQPAVAELHRLVGPMLDRFAAALRGADDAERAAIATVLGRIGDASVLPALARLLDDPALAAIATEAIQRISETATAAPSVLPLLADERPEVRARACEALARIGDTSVVAALFELLGDPNPMVAHAAAAAIQALGSVETTPRTLAALAAGSPGVRRQALRILAYLGSPGAFDAIRAAVDDPDRRIAELAITALGALDEPRAAAALAELAGGPQEAQRAAAMRAIARRGDDISLLERGLADDAAWVRYYACQGLGRLGRGEPLLIARLADPAPHVRIAALEALAQLETPAAWTALSGAAGSPDPDVQRAALVGIGLRVREGALPFLLAAAGSADDATRLIAMSGLARRPEPEALAALATAAHSATAEIADAALSLLSDRTDRAAADVIVELALAAPPDHPAHRALSQPARIPAIAARLEASGDREIATLVAALGRMRADAALIAALVQPNPTVRRVVATTLVAIGAPGARALVAELAATDPDLDVRRACAAAVE